jgi:hypothetical protein
MKTKLFILACLLFVTIFSFAQTKRAGASKKPSVYHSVTDLFEQADCYYTPGKYTPEELKNTEILTSGAVYHDVYWSRFIDRPTTMTDEQYDKVIRNFVSSCPLVKGEFWENLRKEFLKKFDYQAEIERLESDAVKDPSVLKNSSYADYCKEYVDMLNGSDEELMEAWKNHAAFSAKHNTDPQRIMREFRKKANEPNWIEHARKELITYEWGQCITNLANEGKFYQLDDQAIHGAFRKLFVKIDEEPQDY